MARGSLAQGFWRLSLPVIFMNISVPLVGAVDTAVVGHLSAVYFVGAVGVGAFLFNFLYWSFGFFRMSTVGLAAQAHGRGDRRELANVLARGLLLAVLFGLGAILLKGVITHAAFLFIKASPEVTLYATEYVHIRVWAAPAVFAMFVFTGWFFGVNNTTFPVVVTLVVNLLNAGLDYQFVVVGGMTSAGVAWATVISQYVGLGLVLVLFGLRYRGYLPLISLREVFQAREVVKLLKMNSDIFVRTVALLFSIALFTSRSAAQGDLILAANTILVQFRYITAFALDGFAVASEVLTGAAVGTGDMMGVRQVVKLSLIWGFGVGLVFSVVYLVGGSFFLRLFTDHPGILATAGVFLVWVVVDPLVANFSYMLDGVMVGATATRTMVGTMIFSVFVIYLPVFFWFESLWGNHGIWAASLVLFAARALTQIVFIRKWFIQDNYRMP